jgi:hypothetical protein
MNVPMKIPKSSEIPLSRQTKKLSFKVLLGQNITITYFAQLRLFCFSQAED